MSLGSYVACPDLWTVNFPLIATVDLYVNYLQHLTCDKALAGMLVENSGRGPSFFKSPKRDDFETQNNGQRHFVVMFFRY